jgi:multiple sugar transport system substrate-binding protein
MRKLIFLSLVLMLVTSSLGACKTVVEKTVEVKVTVPVQQTVEVKSTVEVPVSVEKTVVVEKTVQVPVSVEKTVEVVVTPTQPPPVTIKILNYSQEQAEFYKEAAQVFHDQYPWITVVWDTMAQSDYMTTLPLMFQNNESPDIFSTGWSGGSGNALTDALTFKWVQPFDETALAPNFRDRFPNTYKLMENIYSKDGKIYTIPRDGEGPYGYGYMYYNPDVFTAAGLDPVKDVPTTWDQLLAVCHKIRNKAKGIYCVSIPEMDVTQTQRILIPFIPLNGGGSAGGMWQNNQTGLYDLENPNIIQVLKFVRQLYTEDLAIPGLIDKAFSRAAIANGTAAIYFDGGWMPAVFAGTFNYTGFKVALVPASTDQGSKGKLGKGVDIPAMWISSQSKHPYEATLFLNWMTEPDGWFATQYLARGFGFLSFADNNRYVTDPSQKLLIQLAPQMQVVAPNPVLKCPDLLKSQAIIAVDTFHPNWDWEVVSNYFLNGGDIEAIAKEVDAKQNEIFLKALNDEKAAGLNVSADCYAAPDWDMLHDYDYSVYFK